MKLNVIKSAGGGSKVEVSESTFGARFNEPLVHQIVVAYLASGRQGTRAQKNRAAVRGGGRKPWAQKGTGHARAGTIRSPLWRGGGKIFPAQTRDFSQKVNRKMYQGALRAILSELVRQERLLAVDEFKMDAPKTKALRERLGRLGINGNALIVVQDADANLSLSARNLPWIDVCDVGELDPVRLVRHEKVVMTVAAVKRVEELLA